MVLPFLALGAMALGGVASAVGASKQAKATNEGIEKANKAPLKETLKEKTKYGQKITTSYGQKSTTTYGQKVSNTASIDLARLVSDAEAAGFNPMTIVRSGGLSGYFNTTMQSSGKDVVQSSGRDVVQYSGTDTHSVERTTTGHNAHLYANKQSPGGAFLSGIGNTIGQVASAGLQNTQHLQSLASNERIAAISALPSNGFGRTGGSWGSSPAYGGVGYGSGPLGINSHDRWTEEVPSVTNPMSFDWWESNPRWADIETSWEARLGDVGGTLAVPFVIGADIGHNLRRGWDHLTQSMAANLGGSAPPLQITVGGPNQTAAQ